MKPTLTLITALLLAPLGALHAAEAAKPIPLNRSPITNRWGDVKPVKIPVEHVTVFRGREGESYNHVQHLTSHDGKLYATWALGLRDEEAPGQRMVMAVSEDHGRTWSAPTTIAPSRHGKAFQSNVNSCGLRILPDGRFVAYSAEWEWEPEAYNPDGSRKDHPWDQRAQRVPQWNPLESRTEARVSTDGGRSWGEPVVVAPNQAGFHGLFQTRSGRLILPGNFGVCHYTDDPTGLTGWKRASIPGLPSNHSDNYFRMYQTRASLGIAELFSEACVYQTDNGVLHMMMRNNNGPMLGVTESRDDGLTWSTPMLTSFTDNACRSHFGRLPDGRFFALSCPAPSPKEFAGADAAKVKRTNLEYGAGPGQYHLGRTPLVLALSRDGITYDRHFILGDQPVEATRISGKGKGGRYGYPYLHVMGDEVFAIYSVNKDDIAVGRFKLADIAP